MQKCMAEMGQMKTKLNAIFENGVFVPRTKCNIREGAGVEIMVNPKPMLLQIKGFSGIKGVAFEFAGRICS